MDNAGASTPDDCGDGCGWLAAILAALAYGSYGVPIKISARRMQQDVHPWVWQSYKCGVVMAASPLVATFLADDWKFTPWGLVSGTLWTGGGVAGVYAIRHAGLAVAVGTWSTVMVAVNFTWGFIVFQEPIHDPLSMLSCFLGLAMGLTGMSYYAAPPSSETTETSEELYDNDDDDDSQSATTELVRPIRRQSSTELRVRARNDEESDAVDDTDDDDEHRAVLTKKPEKDTIQMLGMEISRRASGVLAAAVNGVLSGSSLFPIRYAKQNGFGGANFFHSFAVGALLANTLGWMVWWVWLTYRQDGDWAVAWRSLPSWHVSKIGGAGVMCGSLLMLAMLGSMISVTYLGQGVGNSVIQAKIIVSGLWGIFFFHEVRGNERIAKWLGSAMLAVCSILWLSAQRTWSSSSVPEESSEQTEVTTT